jgi:hypothetical protein
MIVLKCTDFSVKGKIKRPSAGAGVRGQSPLGKESSHPHMTFIQIDYFNTAISRNSVVINLNKKLHFFTFFITISKQYFCIFIAWFEFREIFFLVKFPYNLCRIMKNVAYEKRRL